MQSTSSNPSISAAGSFDSEPIDPNDPIDPDIKSDAEQWELDDETQTVAEEQDPAPGVPKGNLAGPASVERLVSVFVAKHPPDDGDAILGSRLPYSVILSQHRPGTRGRGFVRPYPQLQEDVGIDEATWMEFLENFDESIKVCKFSGQDCGSILEQERTILGANHQTRWRFSPIFDVALITAGIVGPAGVASPTIYVLSNVVQAAEILAKEAYDNKMFMT